MKEFETHSEKVDKTQQGGQLKSLPVPSTGKRIIIASTLVLLKG